MNLYEIRRRNLRYIIDAKFKGNAAAFGRAVGKDGKYINRLLWGVGHKEKGGKNLGEELAIVFCTKLKLENNWFDAPQWEYNEKKSGSTLGVDQERSVKDISSNAEPTANLATFSKIPVRGIAQLGDNGHWSEIDLPAGYGDGVVSFPTRDKDAYAVRCVGDSMSPRIKDGEFVVIEPGTQPNPGDEVLVSAIDGRVMIKTFLYETDEKVVLISVNDAHPKQSIDKSMVRAMHYVAAIAKKPLFEPKL